MKASELTFVTVLDGAEALCGWAAQEKIFSQGRNAIRWIVFERSSEFVSDSSESDDASLAVAYAQALERTGRNGCFYQKVDPGISTAACYNQALERLETEYVCFTNGHIRYLKNVAAAFSRAHSAFPDESVLSIEYKSVGKAAQRDRFRKFTMSRENLETASDIRIFLHAYFLRRDLLEGMRFSDVCEEETGTEFLLRVFQRHQNLLMIHHAFCYYDEWLSRESDDFYGCRDKDFYLPSLKQIYKPLFQFYRFEPDGKIPLWMQKTVYYQIYFKYYANLNVRDKFLLNGPEKEEFYSVTSELLQEINDNLIMDNQQPAQYAPPFSLRNFFLAMKYDFDEKKLERSFFLQNNTLFFRQCGCLHCLRAHQDLTVMAFNLRNEKLRIDLRYFTNLLHQFAPNAIYAEIDDVRYDPIPTGVYALDKVFGDSIEKSFTFRMEFSLEKLREKGQSITFWLELNGQRVQMPLFFYRPPSKLNSSCPHSYWQIDENHILEYREQSLRIVPINEKQRRQREKQYHREMVTAMEELGKSREQRDYCRREVTKMRKLYFQQREQFAGRRIWLFFDKLYKAGDNGEYAFRYAHSVQDGIECYYVINKDAPDYPRLREEFEDHILLYNSHKCKLYALMAETIIATHPDIMQFFGYTGPETAFMRDLFNANLVCIAHGVTIQKNADYQNRLYDNTMFYTTSSKYEVQHILQPIYGYASNEVALTGMARFDGLKDNDQKQILITPTWRRNLVGTAERNTMREYNELFKQSDYYKIYNHLINDECLIRIARENGYRILFLLHPSMSAQIDDYDRNGFVEIVAASGDMSYEKVLRESSLMVTDYSGIHYDFAYMRKPVLYYQPKEIPMRFEEGGMKFATMGFGPVCTEYEEAVHLICEYMEHQCVMQPEYRRRADDFFAFDDDRNSQRIYEAIKEWVSKKELSGA